MGNTPSSSTETKDLEEKPQKSVGAGREKEIPMPEQLKDVSMVDVSEAAAEPVAEDSRRKVKRVHPGEVAQTFSQLSLRGGEDMGLAEKRSTTLIFDYDDDMASKGLNHAGVGSNSDIDSMADDRMATEQPAGSSSSSCISPPPQHDVLGPPAYGMYGATQPQGAAREAQAQPPQPPSQQQQQQQQQQQASPPMVPVEITWQQGGSRVYVTGSFTGWRKMIGLVADPARPGVFQIKLQLPPGTHRFRFIVDNELRFSDFLLTATDQMGNFVNYLEIVSPQPAGQQHIQAPHAPRLQAPFDQAQSTHTNPSDLRPDDARIDGDAYSRTEKQMSARSKLALQIEEEPDDMGDGYTRFHEEIKTKPAYEFTQDIPAVFTDPSVMGQYYLTLDQQQHNQQNLAWLTPPQLPPHLEHVILNHYNKSADGVSENTSGALPIPNHVVLNHLATSSIKHNTLCVASIVRYKQKYATQILYAPLQ
ncbi:AER361Cp [Eremothecium gossypii ATCC 10895]|uniref:AER361Cp n=1 Tax=Eremothecium gossypii (strain ATCC 10895 / CBS 109.51 / FGSC 9923 / NRRL Y-1056) TaxID=284811 RepID=Q756A6_EREGS|nr:AER361Cp [Eremothecium gossypii ATCC 10895]AAS53041.1 AER361Cp [Eremothecium gossypii ATCC 10895]